MNGIYFIILSWSVQVIHFDVEYIYSYVWSEGGLHAKSMTSQRKRNR